jgi:hypothetical protein
VVDGPGDSWLANHPVTVAVTILPENSYVSERSTRLKGGHGLWEDPVSARAGTREVTGVITVSYPWQPPSVTCDIDPSLPPKRMRSSATGGSQW